MNKRITRREFLAAAAIGGLGLADGCAVSPAPVPALRRPTDGVLRHACVGTAGIGAVDLDNLLRHPKLKVVALCDVDAGNLEAARKKVPDARVYRDWRELLARETEGIHSCNVSVPDHMHALIALAAIRRGLSVYCQKPLAHDVAECRALTLAARRGGVLTQLGTQHASGPGDRLAVHYLRTGVLGKVRRVILCSNRAAAVRFRLEGPRPAAGTTPPATLDWDHWLGTAPARPYAPDIYHPRKWRAWQDFGTGWSGDIGCHLFDAVWKGLALTAPLTVTAKVQDSWRISAARRGDTWPQSNHITWVFPGSAMTEREQLPIDWYDGEFFPPEEAQAWARSMGFTKYPEEAALVIGTEGALLLPHTSGPRLAPTEKFQSLARPNLTGPNHYHRFVDACLEGGTTESNFDVSGPMAEAVILGTVAVRAPGETLAWDSGRMQITNSAAANRWLRRSYRRGWEVELAL